MLIDAERLRDEIEGLGIVTIAPLVPEISPKADQLICITGEIERHHLMNIIRDIPDSHVMLQTLRIGKSYNGKRDYDLH